MPSALTQSSQALSVISARLDRRLNLQKCPQTQAQALLIEMLQRPEGASITEIVEATSWQAHTARGAISGALKKKLGLPITSEKHPERGTVYKLDAA